MNCASKWKHTVTKKSVAITQIVGVCMSRLVKQTKNFIIIEVLAVYCTYANKKA